MNHKGRRFLAVMITALMLCFTFASTAGAVTQPAQDRLYGTDRYATAIAISQRGWPDGADSVLIARGNDFADALCAGPLAKKLNGPVLLTPSSTIPETVLSEIKRLKVKNVYIIGGTGAVSASVADAIKGEGSWTVSRIYGTDRYGTSVEVAKHMGKVTGVALATGINYPDALSISSIASSLGMPILLTKKSALPAGVKSYISGSGISKTYVVGGTGVITDGVKGSVPGGVRLWGSDRYDTNVAVLKEFKGQFNFSTLYLAVGNGLKGNEFADALTGGVLASNTNSPVILAYRNLSKSILGFISDNFNSAATVIALGGSAVMPSSISQGLFDATALAPINRISSAADLRTAIESANSGLSVKVSSTSVYGKLSDGQKAAVAADLLANKPQLGYTSNAGLEKVFDRLVQTRTVIAAQLKAVNDAASSNDTSALKALGCSFITNVRVDLQDASKTYSKIDNTDVDAVVLGLQKAEASFSNTTTFTQAQRDAMYSKIQGQHFDSYRDLLKAINDALPDSLKVEGL